MGGSDAGSYPAKTQATPALRDGRFIRAQGGDCQTSPLQRPPVLLHPHAAEPPEAFLESVLLEFKEGPLPGPMSDKQGRGNAALPTGLQLGGEGEPGTGVVA